MIGLQKLSFLAAAKRPFSNLSPTQRVLFSLRCGCSILTISLIIVIAVFQKYPLIDHVASIGCGHVDVALGLYRSLQVELSGSSTNVWAWPGVNMPIAQGLSDSSINMLSDYTQEVVANAPQSILLAFTQYCTVRFNTDFQEKDYYTNSTTVVCSRYTTFNLFNYRQMMAENDLDFMLAYSNETTTDAAYVKLTNDRQRRFNSMRILFYTQGLSQGILLIACFIVYSNRGSAKDLSKFRRTSLHVVTSVAVQAAISIIIPSAVVTYDLTRMKKEVSQGLGDYGIVMRTGKLFSMLFWLTFCFSIISSFSWILPVWCSNPPKQESELVYSSRFLPGPAVKSRKDKTYVIRPYIPRRKTTYSGRSSRLFYDDETKDDTSSVSEFYYDHDSRHERVPLRGNYSHGGDSDDELAPSRDLSGDLLDFNDDSSPDHGLENSSKSESRKLNKEQSELELRRLGRKMTMNASTRTRKTGTPELDAIYAAPKEDTHNLLYGDNFSSHQYPQTFGKNPNDSVTRVASLNSSKRSNSRATRHLIETDRHAFSSPQTAVVSDDVSLLNEDEAKYLDQNNFVNRI